MAKLVTKKQRIITGVTYPKSVYSRQVSCMVDAVPALGTDWTFTPTVGERVWLLGIKVWGDFPVQPTLGDCQLWIHTGTSRPTSYAAMEVWKQIMAVSRRDYREPWYGFGEKWSFSWDMAVLFDGAGRRFGFRVRNRADNDVVVQASFLISEG